jgi:class 3 adenylate cyclase/tetratricopeptide (TPR) repeat protein
MVGDGETGKDWSPYSYVPRHLAEKIRASIGGLENERKQVSVLFADLKSSLELIAGRDPEDVSKILDAVLQHMIEAVQNYEGTVNRVMGDGIMALFGAPVALEDHAVRACYSALMMQDTIKLYSEEVRRSEGLSIQVRVGINSGEVIVRSINSDLQMDYAAVGETTHLAARMEQIATPGSVLITAEVMKLVEGYVEVKPLGPVSVKGLRTSVEVFELVGAGVVRSRLQAAAARGLTRFTNRLEAMQALHQALHCVNAGEGQIVAVVGEAGIGKSRLLHEFIHSNHTRRWLILESNSMPHGRAAPYFPLINLLKNYFKIDARDDQRTIAGKVTTKILTLDQSLHAAIPPILYLLEALPDDHVFHGLAPSRRHERTTQAITGVVRAESFRQPVIMMLEDLHLNDSSTVGVLKGIINDLPGFRALLLVSYRPQQQDDWGSLPCYRRLMLDPLPRECIEELLLALLGSDPNLTDIKELLTNRVEGNPFFLEELVRTLLETGVLRGERGTLALAKTISKFDIAPLVQAVIASRIDRLSPREKRLLHEASVIGRDVPFTLLHAITGFSEEELKGHLANLRAAEFLYETRLFPDVEYTFKHSLTQEVAFAGLLHEHRREIHARIMLAMENLYSSRLNEHVEQLAHHAYHGQIWPKALMYLRQAGAKAVDRLANRQAVTLFGRALEALKHLPEDDSTLAHAIDIRFEIRNALQPLGELSQILENLQEAERLAVQANDQLRLGWVAAYLTEQFRMLGDTEPAAAAGERALSIAQRLDDAPLHVVTNLPMGLLHHAMGNYRSAIEFFQWNVDHLTGAQMYDRFGLFGLPSVHSRTFLAWCYAELGEFARGFEICNEGIRIAQEREDQALSLFYAYLGLGVLYLRSGHIEQAIMVLKRALALTQFSLIPVGFSYGGSYLGYALALDGRVSQGLPLLEQTTGSAISMSFIARHSLRVAYLGEAYLLAGRIDDAAVAAGQALEFARLHKERGHKAYALRLRGAVAARRGEAAEARTSYHRALDLAQELGMRPLEAHCHWGLARLSRGQDESPNQHLAAARALFQELEMVGWLQQMETEFADPSTAPHER